MEDWRGANEDWRPLEVPMTDDPRAAAFYEALDSDQAWRLAAEYGRGAAMKVLLPAVLACHERLCAAPDADRWQPIRVQVTEWRDKAQAQRNKYSRSGDGPGYEIMDTEIRAYNAVLSLLPAPPKGKR